MAPIRQLHTEILIALSAGPVALVVLGRMLPGCCDFGRELADLIERGWVRGPRHFVCDYELTDDGRRAMTASALLRTGR